MQNTDKKIAVSLLLFSHMLTSCNSFKIAHRNSAEQAQQLNICAGKGTSKTGSQSLQDSLSQTDLSKKDLILLKKTVDGATPLYIAAQEGHLEVVRCLVGQGANVDQDNKDGSTPLYIAAHHGHLAVVQLLVENGANVNHANNNGITPLYIATQKGHREVVQYLAGQRELQLKVLI